MQTAFQLFISELRDLLNCENRVVHVLGEAERESTNDSLVEIFREHRKQTEQQAARLIDVFRDLGEVPEQAECHGIEGLIAEKQVFLKKDPSHELLDFFNVVAGIKAESYEMAAYESLLLLAREMRMSRAVELLEVTLNEERDALHKLTGIIRTLIPLELGIKEQPEGGLPRKAA